jgi:hypothetical protein
MKRTMIAAALALLMTSGAAYAEGMPIHADDPWAKAIGDTRTLEGDHIGCSTQDNVKLVNAIQRNTIGLSMDLPDRCVFFPRGAEVVVVKLEYSASGSCGIAICAQIHLVGDQRRYWMDAPVELFEVRP